MTRPQIREDTLWFTVDYIVRLVNHCMCPEQDQTLNSGIMRRYSNQLSHRQGSISDHLRGSLLIPYYSSKESPLQLVYLTSVDDSLYQQILYPLPISSCLVHETCLTSASANSTKLLLSSMSSSLPLFSTCFHDSSKLVSQRKQSAAY